MDDEQMTPYGYPNFNSYVSTHCAWAGVTYHYIISIWSTRESCSYGIYAFVEQIHKCKVYHFSHFSYDSYVENAVDSL
jgi:hypothetical protein